MILVLSDWTLWLTKQITSSRSGSYGPPSPASLKLYSLSCVTYTLQAIQSAHPDFIRTDMLCLYLCGAFSIFSPTIILPRNMRLLVNNGELSLA